MPTDRSVSAEDLLHELLPIVERSLDRHVTAATEWFPHELRPVRGGAELREGAMAPRGLRLPDVAQMALEVNLLTEDNLPYYHLAFWRTFGEEEVWGEWVRRWTAEEGRHAIVIRDYLTVTRGCDPKALEQGRMDQALRGWNPEFAEQGPLDGVVFTTLQELATRISHRNTGEHHRRRDRRREAVLTGGHRREPALRLLSGPGHAGDRRSTRPRRWSRRCNRQVIGFAMPGAGIPGVPRQGQGDGASRHLQRADPPRAGAAPRP